MAKPLMVIDPNPCLRYRWSEAPCRNCYSGSHACGKPGGHAGTCVCDYCGAHGRGKDRASD